MSGKLWIVATPIGNIDDFSARAITVLNRVNLILAEDTRRSRLLLEHYHIATPMQAWHLFNERRKLGEVLQRLLKGEELALISDAGTPLISDPGFWLVDACFKEGVAVSTVPGACAAIAAISVSGLDADHFYFEGFLPAKRGDRIKRLQALANLPCTMICYEAPHRLLDSLMDMEQCLGSERVVTVVKELTKLHEQAIKASLCEQISYWNNQTIKGEWVIVVDKAPAASNEKRLTARQERLLQSLLQKMPAKQAVKLVADLTDMRANDLYKTYCSGACRGSER